MMGVVTVLEGLLPSLPEPAILRQLVRSSIEPCMLHLVRLHDGQHTHRRGMHMSHACGCFPQVGPAELPDGSGTRPTELLQLLLAPDVHRHASPQLRNRIAGLLLQVLRFAVQHGWVKVPLLHRKHEHIGRAYIACHKIVAPGNTCTGVQGGWRAAGISGCAAATAAAHLPLPCGAARCIRRRVQHQRPQWQH
jgi:hypothetical protein